MTKTFYDFFVELRSKLHPKEAIRINPSTARTSELISIFEKLEIELTVRLRQVKIIIAELKKVRN